MVCVCARVIISPRVVVRCADDVEIRWARHNDCCVRSNDGRGGGGDGSRGGEAMEGGIRNAADVLYRCARVCVYAESPREPNQSSRVARSVADVRYCTSINVHIYVRRHLCRDAADCRDASKRVKKKNCPPPPPPYSLSYTPHTPHHLRFDPDAYITLYCSVQL